MVYTVQELLKMWWRVLWDLLLDSEHCRNPCEGSSGHRLLRDDTVIQTIRRKAGIPHEAMKKLKVTITLWDYSQRPFPILIIVEVDLEISQEGGKVMVPVYLRLDEATSGEPCLLGTNVILPLWQGSSGAVPTSVKGVILSEVH